MGRSRRRSCPVGAISISEIDATPMARNLYQGGLEAFEHAPCEIGISDVDLAVVLAPDTGVRLWHPETLYCDLEDDAADLERLPELIRVAAHVARRLRRGERVAIFCRQGRNRSGLLTALVLLRLRPTWSGSRVRRYIQERRDGALTNEHFAWFLDSCEPGAIPG